MDGERAAVTKVVMVCRTVERVTADLAKWGALALIAYWAYRSIDTLAGRVTVADIRGLVAWPDGEPWILILASLVFGAGGIAYGAYERRIRQDAIERMHDFQVKYERSLDPKRSSSKLTPRGETRPEDA